MNRIALRYLKIFSKSNFDVLLCECGNYGRFRSEPAAVLAAKKTNIPIKSIVIHHECVKAPLFMGFVLKIINYFFSNVSIFSFKIILLILV